MDVEAPIRRLWFRSIPKFWVPNGRFARLILAATQDESPSFYFLANPHPTKMNVAWHELTKSWSFHSVIPQKYKSIAPSWVI